MQKILISSCLLGFPVRYNGKGFLPDSEIIGNWLKQKRLIGFCPEVEGGLTVPRPAAEIRNGHGKDVLEHKAQVLTKNGENVTMAFIKGSELAVKIAREKCIQIAVLKSNSPACGFGTIYDGTFSGVMKAGDGVTTAVLKKEGIKIFDEKHLSEANLYLNQIESIQ
jgi:uncharacterized protein YbbK (DUF523 family)